MGIFGGLKKILTGSFDPFETKIDEIVTPEGYYIFGLSIRGSVPIKSPQNLDLVSSIIDVTDPKNLLPIMYLDPQYVEDGSAYFRDVISLGNFQPNRGWNEWIPISVYAQDLIYPPHAGLRTLAFHTRIVDVDRAKTLNLTKFDQSYLDGRTTKYSEFQFLGKHGYVDFDSVIEKLELITVKIAMYIAMVDGSLHKEEGNKIKGWVKNKLESIGPKDAEKSKKKFNSVIKNTHSELLVELNIKKFKKYLNEFNNDAGKFDKTELFTLILDVMVSDGIAHEKQMELINIAKEIVEYDVDALKSLQDKKIINLENLEDADSSFEDIVGIKEYMSNEQINDLLADEFNKWNARRESLKDPKERDNATKMLEIIATLKDKHTS